MKNKFLLFLMLGMTFFAACNDDDDPEVPPTLNEVAGEYTGDKLTATIDGTAAGENASVKITRESDTTATLVLNNIVPNYESFEITKAAYTTASRSSFYSKLAGEATSEAGDLKVAATAEIENGVMTLTVTTESIEITNPLYGTSYTGDMDITVNIMPGTTTSTQTVYINAPTNGEDNYINLLIKDFSFMDQTIGDIELQNIELMENEGNHAFTIADYELSIPALESIGTITADAEGLIVNETNLTLELTIQASAAIKVGVDFEGTKNTTEE